MAVVFDCKGSKLAVGDAIAMGPNHYGVREGTRGKVVACLGSGSIRVELSTDRGAVIRVVLPTTVWKT